MSICLEHLLPQIDSQFEVLIVDNNSTDDTYNVVVNLQKNNPSIKYVFCATQGLSYARNDAVKNCQSPWLSFLDDDAYPAKDWLKNNISLIESNKYEAFGGVYLPWYYVGKKDWFFTSYESNATFMPKEQEKRLKVNEPYFSGGNCTFKVDLLRDIGGFSAQLGMNGNAMGYGEEVAAQRAIAADGGRLGFSRNMIIYHYVPLRKQTISWAWKKAYKIGRDFWFIWDKPVTLHNFKFYLVKKTKKCFTQTKRCISNWSRTKNNYSWKNALYEMAGWAGLLGLLIGSVKRLYRDYKFKPNEH